MAEADEEWSSPSNDAFHISLVTPGEGGPKTLHSFNPAMSYSVFGDAESIFGYKGLNINLRYNACDMRPGLQITYSKKYKTVGETEATDLKAVLEPYLPKNAFEKSATFEKAISDPAYANWSPPGELLKTIEDGDKTLEIWQGNLADPAVQQMVNRIQILVPLFIEGGTFIELTDPEWSLDRWTIFFLYEKIEAPPEVSPYVFMGYCTVYRYFYFQPASYSAKATPQTDSSTVEVAPFELPSNEDFEFSSLPCRSRISQFIILPPFQGGGNGSRFYSTIYQHYLNTPQTIEITVEDPNEAFDDLRDLNDLTYLRTLPEFLSLKINTTLTPRPKHGIPKDLLDLQILKSLRQKSKIAPRQFARVVEMQLLSKIPLHIREALLLEYERKKDKDGKEKEKEYRLWKLWVKKRLYVHNRDTLMQLDRVERIERLEQALGGVEADYGRLLRTWEKRNGDGDDGEGKENGLLSVEGDGKGKGKEVLSRAGSKRNSPGDDNEEEEDSEAEPRSKKVKFA